jgi:hypothetical protein
MTSTLLTPCFRTGLVCPVTEMARIAIPQSKSRVVLCLIQKVLGTSESSHSITRKRILWASDGRANMSQLLISATLLYDIGFIKEPIIITPSKYGKDASYPFRVR